MTHRLVHWLVGLRGGASDRSWEELGPGLCCAMCGCIKCGGLAAATPCPPLGPSPLWGGEGVDLMNVPQNAFGGPNGWERSPSNKLLLLAPTPHKE